MQVQIVEKKIDAFDQSVPLGGKTSVSKMASEWNQMQGRKGGIRDELW